MSESRMFRLGVVGCAGTGINNSLIFFLYVGTTYEENGNGNNMDKAVSTMRKSYSI